MQTTHQPQDLDFSIAKQICLHLIPGLLVAAVYSFMGTYFVPKGLPSILAFFAATVLVLLPFELGILFYYARKNGDRRRLISVILYRDRLPIWQLGIIVIILVAWSALVFAVTRGSLADSLKETLFAWLPGWYDLGHFLLERQQYTQPILTTTWLIGMFLGSFVGPIVEELYFRGFLLPRMSRFGGWAPLIGAVLFSLYHFWSPWLVLVRFLAILPMVYAVWWKRNITIGVVSHVLLNFIGDTLLSIPLVFS